MYRLPILNYYINCYTKRQMENEKQRSKIEKKIISGVENPEQPVREQQSAIYIW